MVCLLHGHMERTDFKKNQRSFIKEVNQSLVNLKFISDTSKQNAIFQNLKLMLGVVQF